MQVHQMENDLSFTKFTHRKFMLKYVRLYQLDIIAY